MTGEKQGQRRTEKRFVFDGSETQTFLSHKILPQSLTSDNTIVPGDTLRYLAHSATLQKAFPVLTRGTQITKIRPKLTFRLFLGVSSHCTSNAS